MIIDKYNDAVHNTIEMSPNQAKKPGNQLMVSYNIWNKSKRDRQYPKMSVGDDVRVKTILKAIKPKVTILNGQTNYTK